MKSDYFLLFSSHFDRDAGLDFGRLSINSLSRGTTNIWVATSSISTLQGRESFHLRGGYLPPQYRVKNLPNWYVSTSPIYLPQVRGVEGNFYKINPHAVTTDRGGKRSDFGIHKDANTPGSLGCIVLSDDRFAHYERVMATFRKASIPKLPLFVQYS